ncbi:MAG: isoleucine--tRNA ligase [Candidatus Altiarchaeota archaeon]|nr:isoleucine--tRNA ligase [Candidatus Altiarchaeota archaeon]
MDVHKLWDKLNLVDFVSKRKGDKFWLLDGPPYPNAQPHMGHVRGVTVKDMLIKIKAMQGHSVMIQPGFDTHGLPIENKVEREQGIEGKDAIEKMGTKEFMKKCKEFATSNIDVWMEFYKEMGVWFGWKKPYLTLDSQYMDSVWWSVSELHKKGLIKQGKKPFYWCPDCQTVLSGYEVTDEYHELDDPSIFVKFPTKKGFSLLAWTTTPWTLPGNVALIVRGDADYVKVETNGEFIVLAKELLKSLDEFKIKYKIIETFKGETLNGLEYQPVFDSSIQHLLDDSKTARRVYLSKQVIKQKVSGKVAEKKEVKDTTLVSHFTNLEDGTGIVHCAPGHGPEDFELGKEYGLTALSPVDEAGKFTADVEQFAGKSVRASNFAIAEFLKKEGYLLGMKKIKHRYPVCWRCKTPLIFRLTEQWLLEIEPIKEKLLLAAKGVEWLPEFAEERMINWLEGAKDWTLSRQRYWNTPLPVWKCNAGHIKVISGMGELSKLSGNAVKDLHRDTVDDIEFDCSECKSKMHRVPDVLDVWYDSGAASFATLGYPHNTDKFKSMWPINWIDEGQDQIRGWFYTLLVLGVALFDKAPYKRVSMHGWVVDEKGEKMSKSKGNFVTAEDSLEKLGPDILRFYILWESSPWDLVRFNPERAKKEVGRMFHIWKNLHSYLVKFSEGTPEKGVLQVEDQWILSKYHSMVSGFLEELDKYNLHHATRKIFTFIVEDLSRKYMKLAKERVKVGDSTPLWILKEIHSGLVRLVAPVSPFLTEEMHGELVERFGSGEKTVFFEKYPQPEVKLIDSELEQSVDKAFSIVESILAYRDEKGIGLRYPIRSISIDGLDLKSLGDMIQSLTNVKKIGSCKGEVIEVDKVKITIDSTQGKEEIQEGLMREVSRRVRSLRRKKGLNPHDKIPVHVWGDSEILDAVKSLESVFLERVGASKLTYGEGGSLTNSWKVKDKEFSAGL